MRRTLLAIALLGSLPVGPFAESQDFVKRDADGLEKKLHLIVDRGDKTPPPTKPLRTPISEREVNSYFKFQGKEHLPVGVLEPTIVIADGTRLEARALVDLAAVRKANERTWPVLLSWVSGVLEVRASAKARDAAGSLSIAARPAVSRASAPPSAGHSADTSSPRLSRCWLIAWRRCESRCPGYPCGAAAPISMPS